MTWRHELKFLINDAAFGRLYYRLRPLLRRDRHEDGDGGYRIRSLYFDDDAKRGIFEKLAGTDPRYKFRVRIYNNSDQVIRLEMKAKSGNLSRKHGCPLSKELTDRLLAGDIEPLFAAFQAAGKEEQHTLLGRFYTDWQTRLLRPALLVDYHRLPLLWPDGNVRVTFDRRLATGLFRQDLWDPDAALVPVLPPDTVILEVKFDHFIPDFIRDALELAGATPLSVSKYVQCAAWCRQQSWEDM
ncbi:MAG: polyphosphate polymerase domain-containing protein [Clostridiaceae bacterium]|jgi:hypothetical protein|nr:polyphosphate polymerase domain-containing protein [Clostridiaceae bacterium]